MTITINRFDFIAALKVVNHFIPNKPVHPSIGCVFLKRNTTSELESNSFSLTGFDLSTSATATVKYKGELKQDYCLSDPSTLLGLLSSFTEDDVSITFNDISSKYTIADGKENREYTLSYLDGDDFPATLLDIKDKAIENKTFFYIDTKDYLAAYNFSKNNVGDSSKPQVLQGINLNIQDKKVTFYATNGHRVSWYDAFIDSSVGEKLESLFTGSYTVSPKILDNIDSKCDVLLFHFHEKILTIKTFRVNKQDRNQLFDTGFEYSTVLIEYEYPNLESLIPKKFDYVLNIYTKDYQDAIKRLKLIDASVIIHKLGTNKNNDSLLIEKQLSNDNISGEELLLYELEQGDEKKIDKVKFACNIKLLADFLDSINSDYCSEVLLSYNGGELPILYSSPGINMGYILMPMKIVEK